jgi:hypothetical protein
MRRQSAAVVVSDRTFPAYVGVLEPTLFIKFLFLKCWKIREESSERVNCGEGQSAKIQNG